MADAQSYPVSPENSGIHTSAVSEPLDQTGYAQNYVDPQFLTNLNSARRTSVTRIYGEMTLGIALTAFVAYFGYSSGLLASFMTATNGLGYIGLVIAQLAVVIILTSQVMKIPVAAARTLFYAYAALTGFTFSSIFAVYPFGNIVLAFIITAGFFFALTMFALTTKMNLLTWGPILSIALIVLLIAEVIMMIAGVSTNTMLLSAATLIIFAGFTAYDAQKTRLLFQTYEHDIEMTKRISIYCALDLYLDFINLFLSLLNMTSRD